MDKAPAAFREELASLSGEEFTSFVAALWRARGRTVTREGDVLRITEPTGDTYLLRPLAAGEDAPMPPDVDVVVTAGRSSVSETADGDLIGPADLYQLVRFSVTETASERLLSTYVDPSLVDRLSAAASPLPAESVSLATAVDTDEERESESASPDPDVIDETTDDPSTTDSSWSDQVGIRRRSVLVAGGAFVGGLVTAAAIRSGGSTDSSAPSPTQADPPSRLAPGLDAEGVTDPERVATAHVARLQDLSYTVRARKTIYDDTGQLRSAWTVSAAVDESRAFRAQVSTAGPDAPPLAGEPPASAVYWSDRDTYLRRISNATGTRYEEYQPRLQINDWYFWSNIVPVGGLPYSTRTFYRDLFQVVSVDVRSGPGLKPSHRIVGDVDTFDPPPLFLDAVDRHSPVTDVSVLGTIEETGLVSSLLLDYDGRLGGRPVDVTWTIEYADLRATTVEQPDWYDTAIENS